MMEEDNNINEEEEHQELPSKIHDLTESIIDTHSINNNDDNAQRHDWDDNIENLLKQWGEKAAGHRDVHLENARQWKRISNRITVPIIFCSTLSSITTITAIDFNDYAYWMYAAASVNVLTAFLTGMNKFLRPDEYFQKHLTSSKGFGKFYRNVQLELNVSRVTRQSSKTFSKWAKTEYDRLINEAPVLSDNILDHYNKKKQTHTHIPDIHNDNYVIDIFGRPSPAANNVRL